ncbi:MAG: hypothetical protein Q4E06_07255 [Lautropia sp.]|nr:hypothetical protein [Lautropia sp.]
MFEGALDQAAGLRRLIHAGRPKLVAAGTLVPTAAASAFLTDLLARVQPEDTALRVVDRNGLMRLAAGTGDSSGTASECLLWVDEPVAMARWVHAQDGDRMLLVLSQRREAMMAQYAEIKKIAATTGLRRFGVLFPDVEQVQQGRQRFLALAGCARRFLSVQLDVVVGSDRDEPGLTMWSGLSMAELADFEWSSWSEVGLPAPAAAMEISH